MALPTSILFHSSDWSLRSMHRAEKDSGSEEPGAQTGASYWSRWLYWLPPGTGVES